MKKLLSLILCLMLALSACAMAETAATVDFGTFTMDLGPNDQYEVADAMNPNQVYAIIYPNYDPNAAFTNSINVLWTTSDLAAEVKQCGGMDKYAQLVIQSAKSQYTAQGISTLNASVMASDMDDKTAVSITTYTLDYSAAGVDMVTDLYQMQALFFNAANDNYLFTLTAHTLEELQAMSAYLDTLTFKTASQAAAPAATAASAATETLNVDFGTFTMDVGVNDHYEVAATMTPNTPYLLLYPDYYVTGQTTNNLNVVYTEDNLALQLALVGGIEKYGELVLQQTVPQYEALGIKMTDGKVLYAIEEDGLAAIFISSNLDYSGAGIDLTLTLYQMIGMFMDTPSGDYLFTLTSDSMETLSEMCAYLDTVQFK